MNRKHFEKFAKIAKEFVDDGKFAEAKAIAMAVVESNDNPKFDQKKFYKACGLI